MGRFRIPKGQRAGLAILLSLDDKHSKGLTQILHDSPKGISINELVDRIAIEGKFSKAESREIVRVLSSLYMVKGIERFKSKDLVEGVCDAALEIDEEKLRPGDGDWDKFKEFFEEILSEDDNIGITLKARRLIAEHEKCYLDSNIYTDIRPVFGLTDYTKTSTAVVIHNLKIEYHTGDRHDEVQIALDSRDLNRLKKQLQRSVEKEEALKSQYKDILDFISPDDTE